jgi:PAT family beta-lactamase induction signal transducer AmpG
MASRLNAPDDSAVSLGVDAARGAAVRFGADGPRRSAVPIWAMGLCNALFGMYGGIIVISVPQLLSARHVAEATIASMTAVMISPGFWTFLFTPVLDVKFSRRWYSVATALIAAALLSLALLNLGRPRLVETLLVAGFYFANLYQNALGGWLSSIIKNGEEGILSVWSTIGNISGGGLMAIITGEVVMRLSPAAAASVLGLAVLVPIAIFPWMDAPGPDRRLARDSFGRFFAEVAAIVKRREVLIAIVLFLAPAATFSLTNLLGGLGADFHASTHFVGLVGGAGVLLGGIAGCLVFPLIDRLLPLRYLYLAIGIVGAAFTLSLILLPRTPATFALALIGENVFQSVAITASLAITYQTVGRGNALAATTYGLMIASFNVSNTYMLVIDGWGYAQLGVTGGYAADAGLSIAASLLLAAGLAHLARRRSRAEAAGQ